MTWDEVCAEPTLRDLPFKIELNGYGQIVMSPASNQHGRRQMRLGALLLQQVSEGEVVSECSVETAEGVKVADIAWLSASFFERHGDCTPYPEAPEVCVEITSPSNSSRELKEKRALYFQHGAKEVWICDSFGNLEFFDGAGKMAASGLHPNFPDHV